MVPAFRLGLGSLLGSPYGGYVMVIKQRGRRTQKTRFTPVNYAIRGGFVYCIAGFGKVSHWIKNIQSHPQVELLLPAGAIACDAEVVEDPQERLEMIRQVLVNSGFAAVLLEGINAARISEEKLAALSKDYVALRFRPTGIGAGPADPRGWFWVWPLAALIALLWWLLK